MLYLNRQHKIPVSYNWTQTYRTLKHFEKAIQLQLLKLQTVKTSSGKLNDECLAARRTHLNLKIRVVSAEIRSLGILNHEQILNTELWSALNSKAHRTLIVGFQALTSALCTLNLEFARLWTNLTLILRLILRSWNFNVWNLLPRL